MTGVFGASGSYGFSHTKGKSQSDYWTAHQKAVEQNLGKFLNTYNLSEGMKKYGGQLAGTYTPESLSALFSGAQAYAQGKPLTQAQVGPWGAAPAEGSDLFRHFQQYNDPAQREAQIASRLEARRRLLAPQQRQEDSALKAKMRSMGLESSSDVLKKQYDVEETRRAEEDLISSDLLDKYEALGYQAGNDALAAIQGIGQMQYSIKNAGLEAEFNEWLRTQPEYNPILDKMMAYLGLQGVSETKSKETTHSFSASASYMSDERTKYDIVDLTPIAFKYKEEYGLGSDVHLGLIAQEVERIYPEMVFEMEINGEMIKHIDYPAVCALLLLALKARS